MTGGGIIKMKNMLLLLALFKGQYLVMGPLYLFLVLSIILSIYSDAWMLAFCDLAIVLDSIVVV